MAWYQNKWLRRGLIASAVIAGLASVYVTGAVRSSRAESTIRDIPFAGEYLGDALFADKSVRVREVRLDEGGRHANAVKFAGSGDDFFFTEEAGKNYMVRCPTEEIRAMYANAAAGNAGTVGCTKTEIQ